MCVYIHTHIHTHIEKEIEKADIEREKADIERAGLRQRASDLGQSSHKSNFKACHSSRSTSVHLNKACHMAVAFIESMSAKACHVKHVISVISVGQPKSIGS